MSFISRKISKLVPVKNSIAEIELKVIFPKYGKFSFLKSQHILSVAFSHIHVKINASARLIVS